VIEARSAGIVDALLIVPPGSVSSVIFVSLN
jgi:hypothetical protein